MANPANTTNPWNRASTLQNTLNLQTQQGNREHLLNDVATGVQTFEQITISIDTNTHPLYLHNNDQPGLHFISKKLTGSENYNPWQRSMQIALNAKNKMAIVNGTYVIPAADSPIFPQWDHVNDIVTSWILNCVSDEISNCMNFIHTAQSVWVELRERLSTIDGHRQLLRDLHTLEQGTAFVDFYYHKMKGIWDEYFVLETPPLCTCGAYRILEEQDQRRKLTQFIIGLDGSYANARGQILMMSSLPNVTQAIALIRQDERQRRGYVPNHTNSTALMANNNRKAKMVYGEAVKDNSTILCMDLVPILVYNNIFLVLMLALVVRIPDMFPFQEGILFVHIVTKNATLRRNVTNSMDILQVIQLQNGIKEKLLVLVHHNFLHYRRRTTMSITNTKLQLEVLLGPGQCK